METASFRAFSSLWQKVMDLLEKYMPKINLTHLLADSAYGSLAYIKQTQDKGMHLISRLATNAALYQPYQGAYQGKGPRKIYGDKYNLHKLKPATCKATEQEQNYSYEFYQIQALSKSIKGITLNVVVLKTIHLTTKKESINVFFSTDLSLDYLTMIDYYSLRFQIEFDFRDAKQHFGLSDFKNYKEQNLTNFVNLSLLMCLVSKILLEEYRSKLLISALSVLDLKILFSARHTAKKLFILTHNQPNSIFNQHFCEHFIPDDLINAA